jgi:hypothetical protein
LTDPLPTRRVLPLSSEPQGTGERPRGKPRKGSPQRAFGLTAAPPGPRPTPGSGLEEGAGFGGNVETGSPWGRSARTVDRGTWSPEGAEASADASSGFHLFPFPRPESSLLVAEVLRLHGSSRARMVGRRSHCADVRLGGAGDPEDPREIFPRRAKTMHGFRLTGDGRRAYILIVTWSNPGTSKEGNLPRRLPT